MQNLANNEQQIFLAMIHFKLAKLTKKRKTENTKKIKNIKKEQQ